MVRRMSMKSFLQSIDGLVLPGPNDEQVVRSFVDYVVDAHSWYKVADAFNPNGTMRFGFFVGPGDLVESEGGRNEERFSQFMHLKYHVPSTSFGSSVVARLPRELYEAGLVDVPTYGGDGVLAGGYKSSLSKQLMVVRIGHMLDTVSEYHKKHFSFEAAVKKFKRIAGLSDHFASRPTVSSEVSATGLTRAFQSMPPFLG